MIELFYVHIWIPQYIKPAVIIVPENEQQLISPAIFNYHKLQYKLFEPTYSSAATANRNTIGAC